MRTRAWPGMLPQVRSVVRLGLVLSLVLIPTLLQAQVWYVNDAATAGDVWCTAIGSSANNGITPATPKRTLLSVVPLLNPGDTLYVDAGTYTETSTITITDNNVWLIGADSATTIIDFVSKFNFTGLPVWTPGIAASNRSGLTVRNLTVRNIWRGLFMEMVSNCLFDNVRVQQSYWGMMLSTADSVTVRACDFSGNVFGLYLLSATHCLVERTCANGNLYYGINLSSSADNVVSNCQCNSNLDGLGTGDGIYLWDARRNRIEGNDCSGQYTGIRVEQDGGENRLQRNRLAGNTVFGFKLLTAGNLLTANEVQMSQGTAFSADSVASCTFAKNNIAVSGAATAVAVTGLTDTALLSLQRNWWGTTDSGSIAAMGAGADSRVPVLPFRLGPVDTSAGADTIAPAVPDGITVRQQDDTYVINWLATATDEEGGGALTGLAGYRLYCASTADTDYWGEPIATPGSGETSYLDVRPGGNWYYRVTAVDAHAPWPNESWYSVVAGAALTVTAVSPADGMRSSDLTPAFRWTTNGDSSRLEVSTTPSFALLTDSVQTAAMTYTPVANYASGTCYWRVISTRGNAVETTPVQTLTLDTTLTLTLVYPAAEMTIAPSQPVYRWNGQGDTYTLQVSEAASFALLLDSRTVTAQQATAASTLLPGTYYWRVIAENLQGDTLTAAARRFSVAVFADTGAMTVYVSDRGDSSVPGGGDPLTAFGSPAAAIAALNPGNGYDTVIVYSRSDGGAYAGGITLATGMTLRSYRAQAGADTGGGPDTWAALASGSGTVLGLAGGVTVHGIAVRGAGNSEGITATDLDGICLREVQVDGCVTGVRFTRVRNSRIESARLTGNTLWGARLTAACGNSIDSTLFSNNQSALYLEAGSDSNLLRGNEVRQNTMLAICFHNSHGNTAERNYCWQNGEGGFYLSGACDNILRDNISCSHTLNAGSFALYEGSHRNLLTGNASYATNRSGYVLSSAEDNVLRGNYAADNQECGIWVGAYAHRSEISDNRLVDNGQAGIRCEYATGCNLADNRINGNDSTGIEIRTNAHDARITRNLVRGSSGDGISVSGSNNAVITGNDVDACAGYALRLLSPATVRRNNLRPGTLHPDSGAWVALQPQLDISRNYWGTDHAGAIAALIHGPGSESYRLVPFRGATVDTAAAADSIAPAAPAGLAVVVSDSSCTISWAAVTTDEEAGGTFSRATYRVYRTGISDDTGWHQHQVLTTDGTTYVDTGINRLTTYYYRVTAFDTHSADGRVWENESWLSETLCVNGYNRYDGYARTDLIVAAVTATPALLAFGMDATFTATLRNVGSQPFTGPVTVTFSLSADTQPDAGDTVITTVMQPVLAVAAEGEVALSATVSVPHTWAFGVPYRILAVLTAADSVPGNNVGVSAEMVTTAYAHGFTPPVDGWAFANYSGGVVDWTVYRMAFGADQVEYPDGRHRPSADAFYGALPHSFAGSCFGFSLSALRLFNGDTPVPGGAAFTGAAGRTTASLNLINAFHLFQYGTSEFVAYRYAHWASPPPLRTTFTRLCAALSGTDSSAYPELEFFSGVNHSVVPYKVCRAADTAAENYLVYVYENNLPGDEARVFNFNLTGGTWSYLNSPWGTLSGGSSSLLLPPIRLADTRPRIPTAYLDAWPDVDYVQFTNVASFTLLLDGQVAATYADSRLQTASDSVFPLYVPSAPGDTVLAGMLVFGRQPFSISGTTRLEATQPATWRVFRQDRFIVLSATSSGGADTLVFAETECRFRPERVSVVRWQIGQVLGDEEQVFRLTDPAAPAGSELAVGFGDSSALALASTGETHTLTLELERSTPAGSVVRRLDPLLLPAQAAVTLSGIGWQALPTVDLQVATDLAGDGTVDETAPIDAPQVVADTLVVLARTTRDDTATFLLVTDSGGSMAVDIPVYSQLAGDYGDTLRLQIELAGADTGQRIGIRRVDPDSFTRRGLREYAAYLSTVFGLEVSDSAGRDLGSRPASFRTLTLTYTFAPGRLTRAQAEQLRFYTYDETSVSWQEAGTTTFDWDARTLIVQLPHLSIYGLFPGAGFAAPAADLRNAVVYPNPYVPHDGDPGNGIPYGSPGDGSGIYLNGLVPGTQVDIYDVRGRLIDRISVPEGTGAVQWDVRNTAGEDVASGVYIILLRSGSETATRKVIVVR